MGRKAVERKKRVAVSSIRHSLGPLSKKAIKMGTRGGRFGKDVSPIRCAETIGGAEKRGGASFPKKRKICCEYCL